MTTRTTSSSKCGAAFAAFGTIVTNPPVLWLLHDRCGSSASRSHCILGYSANCTVCGVCLHPPSAPSKLCMCVLCTRYLTDPVGTLRRQALLARCVSLMSRSQSTPALANMFGAGGIERAQAAERYRLCGEGRVVPAFSCCKGQPAPWCRNCMHLLRTPLASLVQCSRKGSVHCRCTCAGALLPAPGRLRRRSWTPSHRCPQ